MTSLRAFSIVCAFFRAALLAVNWRTGSRLVTRFSVAVSIFFALLTCGGIAEAESKDECRSLPSQADSAPPELERCGLVAAVSSIIPSEVPSEATFEEAALGAEENDERAAAPMCDPTAASVVALPFIPDAQGGIVEELPCDDWVERLMAGRRSARGVLRQGEEPVPSSQITLSRGYAVSPSLVVLLSPLGEPTLLRQTSVECSPQQEFRRRVFRPPVG